MIDKVLRGIVYGKALELQGEFGIVDGQEVEVTLRLVAVKREGQPGKEESRAIVAVQEDGEEQDGGRTDGHEGALRLHGDERGIDRHNPSLRMDPDAA